MNVSSRVRVFFVFLRTVRYRINVNETESICLVMRASLINKKRRRILSNNVISRSSPHVRSSRSFDCVRRSGHKIFKPEVLDLLGMQASATLTYFLAFRFLG